MSYLSIVSGKAEINDQVSMRDYYWIIRDEYAIDACVYFDFAFWNTIIIVRFRYCKFSGGQ